MAYTIRNAENQDLERIEQIYAYARSFMVKTGNPNQWGKTTPAHEQLVQDILEKKLFVVEDSSGIHGVFYFWIGEDPTYRVIEQGSWRSSEVYGTIHRIASDGSGGILTAAKEFTLNRIRHIRIDTHHDNHVMQKALDKLGFHPCGVIYIADGSPRLAYDYLA
ncbi:MAG: N-acetyltransferase [Oscillospiraceae bacterium]|nr:N-acetyltransferase [Oscillospiraceae bacterium]